MGSVIFLCKNWFNFVPKLVIMLSYTLANGNATYTLFGSNTNNTNSNQENAIGNHVIPCDLLTTSYKQRFGLSFHSSPNISTLWAKKSSNGKTVYWYQESSDLYQCNTQGTYNYMAIG